MDTPAPILRHPGLEPGSSLTRPREKRLFAPQTRRCWIPAQGRYDGRASDPVNDYSGERENTLLKLKPPLTPPHTARQHRRNLPFAAPKTRRIRRRHVEHDLRPSTATGSRHAE